MIDELLAFTHELLDETDALALGHFTAGVTPTVKPNRTLVTRADTEVEERIRERIAARWPGHGVLGEELGAADADAEIAWIVDPIDATHNFVRDIGVWATLVACRIGSELVLGAVSAPAMRERWWATIEGGAWRRDARGERRIGVSQRAHAGRGPAHLRRRGSARRARRERRHPGLAQPRLRGLLGPHARGVRLGRGDARGRRQSLGHGRARTSSSPPRGAA